MKKVGFAVLSMAAFLAACADPAANKPKAQTSNVSNSSNSASNTSSAASAPAAADPVDSFKAKGTAVPFSSDNSKVEFTGSKVTGKHDGGFKSFKGIIDLVGDKAADSQVVVSIDAKSVFTDADGLTTHLQSADFFDVEKYPRASFTSTKIVPDQAKGADAFIVTGDLDLHGTKKSITFPATIKVNADSVNVNAEFSFNRKDFGIVYAGKADDLIRDDVVMRLDIQAPKKK